MKTVWYALLAFVAGFALIAGVGSQLRFLMTAYHHGGL